jgi:EAL domain-containing protein (putative c-di-GMP-specific phosphodiesterase class I)
VRWSHPHRGLVLPGSFVGHAEHTGLIRPLTLHVLEHALAQVGAWRRDHGLELSVAVNLSVRTLLDRDLPADVAGLLRKWGVPATALELELTESTIMADPARARVVLEALSALGVGLSIDDFGTGWSSLGNLRALPVDEIKIDRSFVAGMREDGSDATIVRSTIDLGRNLGLRVVAEGVEDEHVRQRLAELGCHLGQGYLFSPPLDGDELAAWAAARALPRT